MDTKATLKLTRTSCCCCCCIDVPAEVHPIRNKIKTCSYIFKDRECNPLFFTMRHKLQTLFQKGKYFYSYVPATRREKERQTGKEINILQLLTSNQEGEGEADRKRDKYFTATYQQIGGRRRGRQEKR